MPRLPQRLALSAQAAEIIKEMIDNQELKGLLPGERTLSSNLQIGRDTLRAALDILEAERWIAPRAHGKRRRILRSPPSSYRNTLFTTLSGRIVVLFSAQARAAPASRRIHDPR